ncbi:MAG: DUF1189 family protein [Stomatobaculum sp.]|nr:DUF1189 family protein [Stomatobaculum sp.]MBR7057967.1 DUF1189 family protein [Stomatobaculum sp.]
MSVFQDFLISLRDYRRYPELLKNGKRRVFAFAALLIFLFWVMTVAVPYAVFQMKTGGIEPIIREYVPEFTLSGGKLDVPGGYHFSSRTLYVDVNTAPGHLLDPEDRQIRTRMALSDAVILADSEKVIYGAGAAGTAASSGARIQYFSAFGDMTFTKADLLSEAPRIEYMYRLFGGMLYFFHLAMFFAGCLVIAIFGNIFSGFTRTPVTFGEVYQLSVYTRSLPLLVKGVLAMAGLVPAELPALSLLFSLFVLSRVFKHIDRERASAGAEKTVTFDFDEFRRQMELRGAELPQENGPDPGDAEAPRQESGEAEPAQQETSAVKEAEKPARKPDLLLPPVSEKTDLRPSNGWSFGTFQEALPEQKAQSEEAQQPEEVLQSEKAPDEEQE